MILKKPKIIIFAVLVLLTTISVAYLLVSTKKGTTPTSITVLPSPNVPNYFSGGITPSIDIKESDFNFPTKLPLLEKQSSVSLDVAQAKAIALHLGFTTEPIEGQDAVNGNVLIWNNKDNFLTIYLKLNKIKFGPQVNPVNLIPNVINKQLSDLALQNIASDFLNNKIQVASNSLRFSNFIYLVPKSGQELFQITTKASAKIIQLNYSLNNAAYPIITQDPNASIAYVQILLDGTIINSEVYLNVNYGPGLTEYSLLNFKQFSQSINNAILVSINDGSVNLPDVSKSELSDIVISKVELGYLLDSPNSNFLSPVFVLRGTVSLTGYANPLPAVLYLPAVVSP